MVLERAEQGCVLGGRLARGDEAAGEELAKPEEGSLAHDILYGSPQDVKLRAQARHFGPCGGRNGAERAWKWLRSGQTYAAAT